MRTLLKIILTITLSGSGIALPFFAYAQTAAANPAAAATSSQFASDGIFGCNQTGAAASSVGAFSASGVYVPVADAAVELNTGYLVYLACSLRPLVSALSQSATAAMTKKILTALNTGNNGGPQFSQNLDNENLAVATKKFVADIQGGILNTLNPAISSDVRYAVVQGYSSATQQPNAVLTCPYSGDLNALLGGEFSWDGLTALQNPACNQMGAALLASDLENSRVADAVQNNLTQLQWGNGVYPKTVIDTQGNENVVTPGAIVLNQAEQALQAGFLKTENAADIGQMVTALFAGIGAQAVSSAQGLAGISQSTNGQPAYIDQVVAAASAGVRNNVVNTAITVLKSVLTMVTNYKSSLTTIANTLIQTMSSLRATESQCWATIIQDVCVSGSATYVNGSLTCTAANLNPPPANQGGGQQPQQPQQPTQTITLKIATTTAFSSAVIQSQITPLATQTANGIASTQGTLNAINALIAGVSNTTSQDAQSLAIRQLDQLTASNSFPKPQDMQAAQQQATGITTNMQILVNQTVQNWQGIDSNGNPTLPWDGTVTATTVGWCDYNNTPTLLAWQTLWKQ